MHRILHFILYVAFSSLFGCSPKTNPASSVPFNDDLTQYRVKPQPIETVNPSKGTQMEAVSWAEVEPENTVNDKLAGVLARVALDNQRIEKVPGYRIQIYSGRDRAQAMKVMRTIENEMKLEVPAYLNHEPPNYKVKIGDFLSRPDAHTVHVQLREDFPLSFIIQDDVEMHLDKLISDEGK